MDQIQIPLTIERRKPRCSYEEAYGQCEVMKDENLVRMVDGRYLCEQHFQEEIFTRKNREKVIERLRVDTSYVPATISP